MTNRADAAESSQTASVKLGVFLLGGRLQRKALVRLGEKLYEDLLGCWDWDWGGAKAIEPCASIV